ncbi:MAG: hypothetical protein ACRC0R_02690, partial [Cetobacterium sp.]
KRAKDVRKIRKDQKLVRVTLDNGKSYRCTLDHKHLMRNNTWSEAKDLKVGDSLMPLYREYTTNSISENKIRGKQKSDFGVGNYEVMWNVWGYWEYTHRKFGGYIFGNHTHHKNNNPKDNRPTNLESIKPREHMKHSADDFWNSENGAREKEIRSESLTKEMNSGRSRDMLDSLWSDESQYERIKQFTTERNSEDWFIEMTATCRRYLDRREKREYYKTVDLGYKDFMVLFRDSDTLDEFGSTFNYRSGETKDRSYSKIFKAYYLDDFRYWFRRKKSEGFSNIIKEMDSVIRGKIKEDEELYKMYKNHKVAKIEFLEETEDVYCMEVEDNHNFALSSGVFVKNSIGIGKSTLAAVLIMRVLYVLSCFENVQSFYGLMPGSPLYIVIISVNREVAEATLYGDLRNKLDMCDYFLEKFPRNGRVNSLLSFPNEITIIFGSNVNSVIGKNVICFACDEAGFRRESAEETNRFYSYLLARNKSRFVYDGGKDGSLAILLSSATTSTSIVEKRKIQSLIADNIVAVDPKLWEVKASSYSRNRCPVFTGTTSSDPCIIENLRHLQKILSEEGLNSEFTIPPFNTIQDEWNYILYDLREKLPDHISLAIIEVPVELRVNFKSNLIGSLQDLAGVAVSPSSKLFTSKKVYNSCIEDIYYPFRSDKIILSTSDNVGIMDYIKPDAHYMINNRSTPRFIHIDGSFAGDKSSREADHTGITCLHISGFKTSATGIMLPIIEVDFQLEIVAPDAPSETSMEKVLDIVFSLEEFIGLNIKQGVVSYDGFQSQFSIQLLDKNGYNVDKISVDRTDGPYLDLVNMMYEGRIKMRNHDTSQRELFDLIHYRDSKKVDHPPDGSKDLADSLCGAVQCALRSDYFKTMTYNKVEGNFINTDEFLAEQDKLSKAKLEPKDALDYNMESFTKRMMRRR